MKDTGLKMFLMAALFVLLLSVPFLVPHMGFLALCGFVPLLMMEQMAADKGVKKFWLWQYLTFLGWNIVTTFWVCNATVGGGLFASLANALQMAVIFGLYRLSRKRFKHSLSLVFLAVMWIAWEHFYFNAEISWPWLVLGNSFARSVRLVQWYEYTGTLGGSLWVWTSNILLFLAIKSLLRSRRSSEYAPGRNFLISAWLVIFVVPMVVSFCIYHNYEEDDSESLAVVIAQPDFDPYQKFQSMTQEEQNEVLLRLFSRGLSGADPTEPVLLLAPETFTGNIITNDVAQSGTFRSFVDFLQGYPAANLLFGASTWTYYPQGPAPSYTARQLRDGSWVESHNSALITDRTSRWEIFHKSKLVVGTELTPYPRLFTRIDDKLGGVMGRCVGQKNISLLDFVSYAEDGRAEKVIPLGSIICYESVYGEYCTGYVREGAEALTVITNDAWWGDTPGYKQHLSYSSLRAIETRRDIARCANTGISAFIDQRGEIISSTDWWKEDVLKGKVNLNDSVTFFVANGDIAGRTCSFVFLLLLAVLVLKFLLPYDKSLNSARD